jgi:hypothetical protein
MYNTNKLALMATIVNKNRGDIIILPRSTLDRITVNAPTLGNIALFPVRQTAPVGNIQIQFTIRMAKTTTT